MSTSMLLGLFDWIGDFFKSLFDLIPKIIYLLYASMACVLDVLQLFFRKLAGLDVYYVDGKPITGDIVTNFITGILGINKDNLTYSALSTVFWSMIVFGIIICFACTIVAIIKSHYNYDEKSAKGPMQYVYTAGKAVINMVAVPIIVVLGLYVSEAILTALDMITSTNSGTIEALYGTEASNLLCKTQTMKGDTTMIYYDIFGVHSGVIYGAGGGQAANERGKFALIASTTQPFSGSLFKVAAYNGNRARLGQLDPAKGGYTGAVGSSLPLFAKAGNDKDVLADMIDTAFACNLHAKNWFALDYSFGDIVSMRYFTNYLTLGTNSFSKFNVGLVWYYYDLWQFNFIVGFAGIIVCISIFINVILGLITRLFMCIVLFLVAPPLFGLAPLDGGKAGKGWRENFMKQALMAYGAVVGMNLVLMILPYMNDIDFFNIPIADYFAQTLVIIVGLITIKAVIATLSGLIGAADANETGSKIKDEVGDVAGKATKMTLGAAKIGGKIGGKVGLAVGSDMIKGGKLLGKGLIGTGKLVGKGAAGIGKGIAKGAQAVAHSKFGQAVGRAGLAVGHGFKFAGQKVGGAFATAGRAVGHGFATVGRGIAKSKLGVAVKNAGVKIGHAGLAVGHGFAFVGQKVGGAFATAGRAVGHGFATAGRKIAGSKFGQAVGRTARAAGGEIAASAKRGGQAIKDAAQSSAAWGFLKNAGNRIADTVVGKKGDDGKRSGGLISIKDGNLTLANGHIKLTKGSITGLDETLKKASQGVNLKDKEGHGVLSQMMTLFHDATMKADSGLGKFNDSSGIKKKPEHDKATAENTSAMAKNTEDMKQEMASMTKAIKELSDSLKKKD